VDVENEWKVDVDVESGAVPDLTHMVKNGEAMTANRRLLHLK